VLCADDYGLGDGVNRAILRLARAGRLSATRLLIHAPAPCRPSDEGQQVELFRPAGPVGLSVVLPLPKLRLNETAPIRGSRAWWPAIAASVASALPSSTNTTFAIAAGLDHARGDAVVIMDSDLQHPPELIETFVARPRAAASRRSGRTGGRTGGRSRGASRSRRRGRGAGRVSFSRNFGKEIAIAAGLDHARGDAVVIMDSDLQQNRWAKPRRIAVSSSRSRRWA
jgi:hypothetical protein